MELVVFNVCEGVMNLQGIYLTARQTQVSQLVAYGYQDAEIAKILGLTVRAIEQHIVNILARLDLKNRYQLQLVVLDRLSVPKTTPISSQAQRKQRNLRSLYSNLRA